MSVAFKNIYLILWTIEFIVDSSKLIIENDLTNRFITSGIQINWIISVNVYCNSFSPLKDKLYDTCLVNSLVVIQNVFQTRNKVFCIFRFRMQLFVLWSVIRYFFWKYVRKIYKKLTIQLSDIILLFIHWKIQTAQNVVWDFYSVFRNVLYHIQISKGLEYFEGFL